MAPKEIVAPEQEIEREKKHVAIVTKYEEIAIRYDLVYHFSNVSDV